MKGLTSLNSHGKYTQPQELYQAQGIYKDSGKISNHRKKFTVNRKYIQPQEIYTVTGNIFSHRK
jgi:hypothetical protein